MQKPSMLYYSTLLQTSEEDWADWLKATDYNLQEGKHCRQQKNEGTMPHVPPVLIRSETEDEELDGF